METRQVADPVRYTRMTSRELREAFLVGDVFREHELRLLYVDTDRAVVGGAMPCVDALPLEAADELRAEFFCERRELGVFNIGGPGLVGVDDARYELAKYDCLYVGRGSREVRFSSPDTDDPARLYLLSYPAHASYPTALARRQDANTLRLGDASASNKRTIHQYIHENGVRSCQLVMGYTHLEEGSVWNTMPGHTHARRSEIYMYFDLAPEARVVHIMGTPGETRHIIAANGQAVVSPSWSMHAGVGTRNYSFVWGMGGENQRFDDMDAVPMDTLR